MTRDWVHRRRKILHPMHKVMQITYGDPIWTKRNRASRRKAGSQGIVERLFLELHISMIKSKYYLLLERKLFLALVEKIT